MLITALNRKAETSSGRLAATASLTGSFASLRGIWPWALTSVSEAEPCIGTVVVVRARIVKFHVEAQIARRELAGGGQHAIGGDGVVVPRRRRSNLGIHIFLLGVQHV